MSLAGIIAEKIGKVGPISFHDFMELSLYHPEYGYYSTTRDKIGKGGDFYTSPCVSSLFGEMIARQLEEMWCWLGKPPFSVVEYGVGTGLLCRDILQSLQRNQELYAGLHYHIIEKSAAMREMTRRILPDAPKVSWHNDITEIPPITGCILSNELIDNFAVHQVVMEDQLMEVFVDHKGNFSECLRPAAQPLNEYFRELQVTLPKGFRTEINLEAIDWITRISGTLKKGFVLTIDYGFPSRHLYDQHRNKGTLVCYHRHRVNYSPYTNIGEQDITTHINFSALSHFGLHNGLEISGFTTQAYFLQGLGLAAHLRNMEEKGQMDQWTPDEKLSLIKTLLMDMGQKFNVLIQYKGLRKPLLSGMRFPQPL
ncbi:SAM-dependent methyltransferase [Flavitalea sp. BT771]|uniref:class I SAM-dependent methyltransferase n=1 Tax=Flavitalea sp. BT771 TaxID=3063329 RepID=UPI0026E1BFB4|nr:SAM-dependent methyltransferase [Flavitalea sp. BT771]MDO6430541.1 SAM-dependent methyltransferase [Flavitalea sp. BT771]MDV6219319.1 SAM-dependent methyltransferase [Flavitalea sp. BT771]